MGSPQRREGRKGMDQTAEILTANPTKGRGERYIFCEKAESGECLDIAVTNGWSAFNCEKCGVYLRSESYRDKMLNNKKMDSAIKSRNDSKKRSDYMSNKKNQLIDLNDSLFSQMDRLTSENLDEKGLQKEILRSKAVSNLAAQIIQNAKLALDGAKAIKAGQVDGDTLMLGRGDEGK